MRVRSPECACISRAFWRVKFSFVSTCRFAARMLQSQLPESLQRPSKGERAASPDPNPSTRFFGGLRQIQSPAPRTKVLPRRLPELHPARGTASSSGLISYASNPARRPRLTGRLRVKRAWEHSSRALWFPPGRRPSSNSRGEDHRTGRRGPSHRRAIATRTVGSVLFFVVLHP